MTYNTLPSAEVVERTMEAMKARNITPHLAKDKVEALAMLSSLIPEGGELMTGSSTTLDQIGFVEMLVSGAHKWNNLKDAIVAEKDPEKQEALRRQSIASDYFVSSVHAVTEAGQTVTASATGSQLPSYTFSSKNVIWVVGTQKIVPTLDDAMQRVHNYVIPLEDKRMKAAGYPGTSLAKLLIFERENDANRHIHILFVNEVLGF